ncbi:hypothetical protein Tco_0443401 [Tanacetum coccineum]
MTAPSTSSTNDVNTASPQVSTTSINVNTASPQQIHEDDLEAMDLKWQLSLKNTSNLMNQPRTMNTGSDPKDAPSEAEESQPLGSRVPLMSEEFKGSKPSGTRIVSSHSLVSSDSTAPLSLDHPLTQVSPTPTLTRVSFHRRTARMVMHTQSTLSPGMSARLAEATTLSPSSFRTSELILDTDSKGDELGEEDTEEDESSDAEDEREGQHLDDEGHGLDDEAQGLDDEGQGLKDECPEQEGAERVSAYRQPTLVTWVDPKDGMVYTDIPTYVPLVAPVQTPPSPEWSLGSLPVSPSSPLVLSPIALLVATPAATISVDEDQFLEVGAQFELHRIILHDHTQRLDELPHTLFEGYDRYLRELYTRPLLALEAWAGQTDAQRAALWHAIYDI